ncbi:MAG: Crp/Fnr family transcriptional regulator [Kangiellaceae bacterium]|nr:Crp/Fnr family transcriptional regulator [Kangiellaceae bacterium]
MIKQQLALSALKISMRSYAPISEDTWRQMEGICHYRELSKEQVLYSAGKVPKSFSFVYQGLLRAFTINSKGKEYTKIFFSEGMFPGSMTALLTSSPSYLAIQAIEPSSIIEIDFIKYRELMHQSEEVKLFQIYYLEKNWLLAKDAREIELVQDEAKERYLRFVDSYQSIVDRIPQYYVASHLGITATQLSRIRKSL